MYTSCSLAGKPQACTSIAHWLANHALQTIYYSRDATTGKFKAHKLKGEEVAFVDQVRACWCLSLVRRLTLMACIDDPWGLGGFWGPAMTTPPDPLK